MCQWSRVLNWFPAPGQSPEGAGAGLRAMITGSWAEIAKTECWLCRCQHAPLGLPIQRCVRWEAGDDIITKGAVSQHQSVGSMLRFTHCMTPTNDLRAGL